MRGILLLVGLALATLSGCKIVIQVPNEGGTVRSQATGVTCGPSSGNAACVIEVDDTDFDDTFTARPAAGFRFTGWRKKNRGLCGGSSGPCRLFTSGFAGNPDLLAVLRSDQEFFLEPVFVADSSGGSGGGGSGGGGGGGASGAAACFNPDLVRPGARYRTELRVTNSDGTFTLDNDHEVFGGASYEGEPARQVVIDFEVGGGFSSTGQITSFIQVAEARQRVFDLFTQTDTFTPQAATTEVESDPPQVERFDLSPGQSYSQTFTSNQVTRSQGQSLPNSIQITNTTTYIGRRTVTVPAGTFEACLFEEVSESGGIFPIRGVTRKWFAVGNGLVVRETSDDQDGNDTTVLLSATINGSAI